MWKLRRFCRVAAEYRWWYLPLFAGIIALFIRWPEQGRYGYLFEAFRFVRGACLLGALSALAGICLEWRKRGTYLVYLLCFLATLIVSNLSAELALEERLRRPLPPGAACCGGLKQVGLALRMYAQDNDGWFPPEDGAAGLNELLRQGCLTDASLYVCPGDSRQKLTSGKLTEEHCSYLYFGGLRALESSREEILVADKPENHGGKFRHRLHVGGHISTRTEEDDGK